MGFNTIIKNGWVYLDGIFKNCDLGISEGKVAGIFERGFEMDADEILDAEGKYVIPGTVDPHVHFRDPGRADRETFLTGTMAAAAGGVTTVLEHPISSPPQYNKEILDNRIRVAKPQACVDFAFFGAAGGKELDEIVPLSKEGIVAYKTFLHEAPPGREKEFAGLTMGDDGQIYFGMCEVAKTGLILAVHAENNDLISEFLRRFQAEGRCDPMSHNRSRPEVAEVETVEKLLRFARETGVRLEIAHTSTAEAMELIKKAKYDNFPVYLETCPHYLILDENAILEYGPFAKYQPPLRSRENVEKLWQYINDGTVDFIGSDHGPFLLSEKEMGYDNIHKGYAGVPGIELRLPLMLNEVNNGRLSLERCIELLSVNPAKCFGLYPKKGTLSPGADADVVIFDKNESYTFHWADSYSKAKDAGHVFEGKKLKGRAKLTMVRGRIVMQDGVVDETSAGWGQLVKPVNFRQGG